MAILLMRSGSRSLGLSTMREREQRAVMRHSGALLGARKTNADTWRYVARKAL